MDRLTAQQRHANMATIRSKDTKPEMIVRRGLWKRGFRYRLNHKRLPERLDLVLRNFNQFISFEIVIDLLQLHQPGNWQDIYNKLNV